MALYQHQHQHSSRQSDTYSCKLGTISHDIDFFREMEALAAPAMREGRSMQATYRVHFERMRQRFATKDIADLAERRTRIIMPTTGTIGLSFGMVATTVTARTVFSPHEESDRPAPGSPSGSHALDTFSKTVGRTGFEPVTSSVSGKITSILILLSASTLG